MVQMRKIFALLPALVLCMLAILAGCARKTEEPQQPTIPSGVSIETPGATGTIPNPTIDLTAEDIDLSSDGWYLPKVDMINAGAFGGGGYYDVVDSVLTFTDLSNGTSVILCSKPGCLHYDEEEEEECDAYIGVALSLHYQDEKVYYVSYDRGSDDRSSLWLMRRNADGTGEEKIGRLASEYITKDTNVAVRQYIFAGNMLYYRADVERIVKSEDMNVHKISEQYLMRMELSSGKDEMLEAYKITEAPLLLGAREDMLLYDTIPSLTEEEETNPDLRLEKPTKLRVWTETAKQSVTLFSKEYKFMGRGSLLGGKYYYRYYENREADESHYKVYDLATQQHKDTDFLTLPVINGRYAVYYDKDTYYDYIYDTVSGNSLPMEYNDVKLSVFESNEEGVILKISQFEFGMPTPVNTEHRYILYSELADGLQRTDGILMPLM